MRTCIGLAFAILVAGNVYGLANDAADPKNLAEENIFQRVSDAINDEDLYNDKITHFVNEESYIDITLSRSHNIGEDIEHCYAKTPQHSLTRLDYLENDDGSLKVMSKSVFVACGMSIGPMKADFIGEWILCAYAPDIESIRCQRVEINWHNAQFPIASWNSNNPPAINQTVRIGDRINTVVTGGRDIVSCHAVTPEGDDLVITPSTNYPHITRTDISNTRACNIAFDINAHTLGRWVVYGRFRSGTTQEEHRQPFDFTLKDDNTDTADSDENEIDEPDKELDLTTLLSEITHWTRQDAMIDVSLDKQSFDEECFVRAPGSYEYQNLNSTIIQGVQVQPKSDFVSCRITIGPITSDYLGEWRLCGKSMDTENIRCQPIIIKWNSNQVTSYWDTFAHPMFTHPVHFGGSVHTGAAGNGNILSCHVVTPAGEDLVITDDVNYPHIEKYPVSNPFLCSIVIKDITADMLGEWVIYGRFRFLDQHEIRLPLKLELYDENNPYEQAYNVTYLENRRQLVRFGTELTLEVRQAGVIEDCIYKTPSGESITVYQDLDVSVTKNNGCQIVFNPVNKHTVGTWTIIGKFSNGVLFDEIRQTFNVIEEDPNNPLEDDKDRVIETVSVRDISTKMDTTHRIVINTAFSVEPESCHIVTPDGRQYAFIPGFHIENVEIVTGNGIECGIEVVVATPEMIGDWTLIARATRRSSYIERRLPFTIRVVEDFVIQDDIEIRKGSDLYLHLASAIPDYYTCKLYGPDQQEYTNAETDAMMINACGYIIRNVDLSHNGRWTIEAGDRIKRRGNVNVAVLGSASISVDNAYWTAGDSINNTIGPDDATYCQIQDSRRRTVFDGFGQCKIVVDRVTSDHRGVWTMMVGLPGNVLLQEHGFYVDVQDRGSNPVVTTTVESNDPSVQLLTCSVPSQHEVRGCKFRDPNGNILVAAHGVGQDGYMFNGSMVNAYESNANSHDCSLRLTNPAVTDMGIWRCAMDTTQGTFYGFLTVISPQLIQDPQIAASVNSEPVLKADESLTYFEGDPVVISCSIPAQLRYCYFRATNGTVYNVFPTMSSENFEYVGAGLDAGDCGIRFRCLSARESGWLCHVGLADVTTDEQHATVMVDIRAKMEVEHRWQQSAVTVAAYVYYGSTIDYCRFVRRDGLGFTTDNVPERYQLVNELHRGHCAIYIRNPTILDLYPWTVVAKVTGHDGEISRTTAEDLVSSVLTPRPNVYGELLFWLIIISLCMIPLLVLIPTKSRKWTQRRADQMRSSFRNTFNHAFKKQPVTPVTQPAVQTQQA